MNTLYHISVHFKKFQINTNDIELQQGIFLHKEGSIEQILVLGNTFHIKFFSRRKMQENKIIFFRNLLFQTDESVLRKISDSNILMFEFRYNLLGRAESTFRFDFDLPYIFSIREFKQCLSEIYRVSRIMPAEWWQIEINIKSLEIPEVIKIFQLLSRLKEIELNLFNTLQKTKTDYFNTHKNEWFKLLQT